MHVAAYVESLLVDLAKPTVKQHLEQGTQLNQVKNIALI